MPSTASGTPLGQSSQSGTRLTGAGAGDDDADVAAADAPVADLAADGDGGATAPVAGIGAVPAVRLDEPLPSVAEGEEGMATLDDADPALFVGGNGEDAAP